MYMERCGSTASSFSYSRLEDLSVEKRNLRLRLDLTNLLERVHLLSDDVNQVQLDQEVTLSNVQNGTVLSFPLPNLQLAQFLHEIMCKLCRLQEIFVDEIENAETLESLVEVLVTAQDIISNLQTVQYNHYHILCSSCTSVYADYAERIMANVNELNESVVLMDNTIKRHRYVDPRFATMTKPDKISILKFIDAVKREQANRLSSFMFQLVKYNILPKTNKNKLSKQNSLKTDSELSSDEFRVAGGQQKTFRGSSAKSTNSTDSGIVSNESHKLPPIEVVAVVHDVVKQHRNNNNHKPKEDMNLKFDKIDLDLLHEKSQQIYTSFFELQYSVFMHLLEGAGKYASLIQDPKLKQVHKEKGVSWADDDFKQKKRSIWKQYVTDLWKCYVCDLIGRIVDKDNFDWVHHASNNQLDAFKKAVSVCFTAVPLPDYIVQVSDALDLLNKTIYEQNFERDLQLCLKTAQNDKCLPKQQTDQNMSTVMNYATETGILLRKLLHNYCNQICAQRKEQVEQLIRWWIECKTIKFLAAYDMPKFVLIAFGDGALCKYAQEIALERLQNKVKHLTIEVLDSTNFKSLIKKRNRHTNSDYVLLIVNAVLEPVFAGLRYVSEGDRRTVLDITLSSVIRTWRHYLLKSGAKLGTKQTSNLLNDLDCFLQALKGQLDGQGQDYTEIQECHELKLFQDGLYSLTDHRRTDQIRLSATSTPHKSVDEFSQLQKRKMCCCLPRPTFHSNKIKDHQF